MYFRYFMKDVFTIILIIHLSPLQISFQPPKCLILQLPRHGTKYKKYDEVTISPTLDITHLIRCCMSVSSFNVL